MKKKEILPVILRFLLILACITGMCGCTDKTVTIDDVRNKGYVVTEVDEGGFYISENGADYYFDNDYFGTLVFQKVVVMIPSNNPEYNQQGLEDRISIYKEGARRMTLSLSRAHINKNNELEYSLGEVFEFKQDFEVGSLTNNRGFSDTKGDYEYFICNRMSVDEITKYYNRGLELEKDIR